MAQGYVDPNWPNPGGDGDAIIVIYGYTPSAALAILGVILFGLSGLIHTYQIFRYGAYYFSVLVVVGTLFEIIGYIFRTLSARTDPYKVIYFVLQYFFVVVAPVFFSASIYAVLSRLINRIGREYTPYLPPRAILWIFIVCDIIATAVQITGAALIGVAESNKKNATTPNNILLGGLAFQVFTFFVFLGFLSKFIWNARKILKARYLRFVIAFVAASLLIYLRTLFRLAETSEGLFSTLQTNEEFFGCLEFAPVVLAVYIFNWWHPGRFLLKNVAPVVDVSKESET